MNALQFAIYYGQKAFVELLLKRGPSDLIDVVLAYTDNNQKIRFSLLEIALVSDSVDVARSLLEKGSKPSQLDSQMRNALHLAVIVEKMKREDWKSIESDNNEIKTKTSNKISNLSNLFSNTPKMILNSA